MTEQKNSSKKLLLIDGYGFLFRAYHSLPPFTNPQGTPVGAVYGFVNMLLKVLHNHEADYLAVIFDAGKKTFRNDIYEQYKANRPSPPDDLIPQFSLVREAVNSFNVAAIDKNGFEADDLIATYARIATEEKIKVTIISADKDLTQLINDNVSLFDPIKQRYITAEDVKEKYGVLPDKMLDLLSLTGDSSDNVPGVPSIGIKTAAQLINELGNLDEIYAKISSVKQDKRRNALADNKDKAMLSRKLIRLDNNVPELIAIKELAIKPFNRDILNKFLINNGFKALLEKINKADNIQLNNKISQINSISQDLKSNPPQTSNPITIISTQQEFSLWKKNLKNISLLAIHCQYNSDNSDIDSLSLACNDGNIAILNLSKQDKMIQATLFKNINNENNFTLSEALFSLKEILIDNSIIKLIYDIKKLLKILPHNLVIEPYEDIMLMSYCTGAGLYEHSLLGIGANCLNIENDEYPAINKKSTLDEINNHLISSVKIILQSYLPLKQKIFTHKACSLYYRLDKPLIDVLFNMEKNGIKLDPLLLKTLSEIFHNEILQLEQKIFHLSGKEFNIASPKQLGEILFVDMGLSGGKKSKKTDSFSTDVNVLEKLSEDGIEIADLILQWRSLSKLKNTYTDSLAKQIKSDQRVHTNYSMAAVNTGRLSSSDPNLQNIPVRTELGNKIRQVFIADDNCKLISADYSQIELRLLAHIADIKTLQEAFCDKKDIHAITASQIFKIPLNEIDEQLRRKAKAINFGIIYGISSFGLATRLGISKNEASDYINNYFKQYPGIAQYMQDTKVFAHNNGYVETLLGRRCYIKGIHDKNNLVRQFSERAAINAPLQGTAADIVKLAMIELHNIFTKKYPEAKILLQVHDEIIVEVPNKLVDEISKVMKQTMENILQLKVPLLVDVGNGTNWKDL